MKPPSSRHRFLVPFSIVAIIASADAAEKRNITEKDLFNFVWIGDTQVSPDGARVAFVRVTVNEKKEGYNTSIWAVATAGNEGPHRLTSGERDSSPRWSPDGKVSGLHAGDREGWETRVTATVHALHGGRRRVSFHDFAQRRR